MSGSKLTWACVLCVASVLAACQPSSPCDPGYMLGLGQCIPIPVDSGAGDGDGDMMSGDGDADDDGGADMSMMDASTQASDPNACEPGGDPSTFGTMCTTDDDCACPAPRCMPSPLGYCSQVECQEPGRECPSGFVCFEVPAALQMDGITHLCLQQA